MSWWYCLLHLRVEEGAGCPDESRLGPYSSKAEADGALARMRQRTEEQDRRDED